MNVEDVNVAFYFPSTPLHQHCLRTPASQSTLVENASAKTAAPTISITAAALGLVAGSEYGVKRPASPCRARLASTARRESSGGKTRMMKTPKSPTYAMIVERLFWGGVG